MREQVITPRNTAGGGGGAWRGRVGSGQQKPARRDGRSSNASKSTSRLRAVLSYMSVTFKIMLAVGAIVLAFTGYQAAASASFFAVRNVDVNATTHVTAADIKAVVRRVTDGKGVWRTDVAQMSSELQKLPWVRTAIVSRVLPDGFRIRVTERLPRAVVHTESGKFLWVDEDAVTLGQMSPGDQMPDFFIRGWDEAATETAQKENRERVRAYFDMAKEWSSLGLSERVSEVNLGDLRDVRAQLAGDDSRIEVRLGGGSFGTRLQRALVELDAKRSTKLGPYITYLDTTGNRNVLIGHNANPNALVDDAQPAAADNARTTNSTVTAPSTTTKRTANDNANRRTNDTQRAQERNDSNKGNKNSNKETRPRRVG